MTEEKIDRINALAHKQQAVGLTEEEKEEQAKLRQEYIASVRASLIIHILLTKKETRKRLKRSNG